MADLARLRAALNIPDEYVNIWVTRREANSGGMGPQNGFATGGYVRGPGGPTDDRIPAWLSNGEYVVNAAATARHRGLLEQINAQRYATGGYVTNNYDQRSFQTAQAQAQMQPMSVPVRSSVPVVSVSTGSLEARMTELAGAVERVERAVRSADVNNQKAVVAGAQAGGESFARGINRTASDGARRRRGI